MWSNQIKNPILPDLCSYAVYFVFLQKKNFNSYLLVISGLSGEGFIFKVPSSSFSFIKSFSSGNFHFFARELFVIRAFRINYFYIRNQYWNWGYLERKQKLPSWWRFMCSSFAVWHFNLENWNAKIAVLFVSTWSIYKHEYKHAL